jgi:hypothetical protein
VVFRLFHSLMARTVNNVTSACSEQILVKRLKFVSTIQLTPYADKTFLVPVNPEIIVNL